jgi:hypothetical protein
MSSRGENVTVRRCNHNDTGNARKLLDSLKQAGVGLIVSPPDSWLVDLEELAQKEL